MHPESSEDEEDLPAVSLFIPSQCYIGLLLICNPSVAQPEPRLRRPAPGRPRKRHAVDTLPEMVGDTMLIRMYLFFQLQFPSTHHSQPPIQQLNTSPYYTKNNQQGPYVAHPTHSLQQPKTGLVASDPIEPKQLQKFSPSSYKQQASPPKPSLQKG